MDLRYCVFRGVLPGFSQNIVFNIVSLIRTHIPLLLITATMLESSSLSSWQTPFHILDPPYKLGYIRAWSVYLIQRPGCESGFSLVTISQSLSLQALVELQIQAREVTITHAPRAAVPFKFHLQFNSPSFILFLNYDFSPMLHNSLIVNPLVFKVK
ncbi:uncharacterized protein LOC143224224 [Tachypleus tridentatus]|uniref:uncharacterized protein LOC143224224 n=1 Tax=Tachypleus tridentatus TaxID=6853 RepID=UPI003FCEEBD1